MKRRFAVEMACSIEIEVDDEAVSEMDGRTVLTVHERDEQFWSRPVSRDDVLGILAVEVGVENRSCDRIDGFADFPEGAVTFRGFPDWTTDLVTEVTPS